MKSVGQNALFDMKRWLQNALFDIKRGLQNALFYIKSVGQNALFDMKWGLQNAVLGVGTENGKTGNMMHITFSPVGSLFKRPQTARIHAMWTLLSKMPKW